MTRILALVAWLLSASMCIAADDEVAPRSFVQVGSVAELNDQLASAGGQLVALRFSADWSITDGEMDNTYASADVLELLEDVVLLEVDITDNTRGLMVLLEKYEVVDAPWMIFFGKDGERIENGDIAGYQPEQAVIEHLMNLFVVEPPEDYVEDTSGQVSED